MEDRTEKLREIRDEVVALTSSPLYEYRTKNNYHPVLGEGSHNAEIVFIGEAPGKNEALTGRPFCGAAGKILDELLSSINIDRKDVYITNIVKDRPPENRDPSPEEIAIYGPFLKRQIETIKPKAIVTLGRFSMRYILDMFGVGDGFESISRIHGQKFNANAAYGPIVIIPMYHPAAAIYNRTTLESIKSDFVKLKEVYT